MCVQQNWGVVRAISGLKNLSPYLTLTYFMRQSKHPEALICDTWSQASCVRKGWKKGDAKRAPDGHGKIQGGFSTTQINGLLTRGHRHHDGASCNAENEYPEKA